MKWPVGSAVVLAEAGSARRALEAGIKFEHVVLKLRLLLFHRSYTPLDVFLRQPSQKVASGVKVAEVQVQPEQLD